jgi:hypothetical protein
MASITSTLATGVTGAFGGPPVRVRFPSSLSGSASAAVTTYYYRTSAGSRGSTTDLGAIPAGAVIERTVTT